MAWDPTAFSLLFTIIAQFILLPITLVYNQKIIKPNKNKSLWKVRRPKFFLFYLIITVLNDITRCLFALLSALNIINLYQYSLLSQPLAYYGGTTWGAIRLWLLYYDIKIAKKNKLFLLAEHLTTTPTEKVGQITKQYKLKKYQSITIKVIIVITIFCLITLAIDIAMGLTDISKLLTYLFIVSIFIWYTYYIFKMCSCCRRCKKQSLHKSPFRDDWLLLFELTIIWVVWIIGIVGAFIFLPFRETQIHGVLIAFLTLITRYIITLTMLIVPYKLLNKLRKEKNNQSITMETLKKILSTKSVFFNFVEHLVQELSIENLSFLVEVWQFKYEKKYKLKPTVKSKKIALEIEKSRSHMQEAKSTEHDSSSYDPDHDWLERSPTVEYEDAFPSPVPTMGIDNSAVHTPPTPKHENVHKYDKLVKFLESLPWRSLPLAQTISSHLCNGDNMENKWHQCYQIFIKYLDQNSYDAVNISYKSRNAMNRAYEELMRYRRYKTSDTIKANELPPNIKTDEEFNEKLLCLFDCVLEDVIHNLRDSVTRFVKTEAFDLGK